MSSGMAKRYVLYMKVFIYPLILLYHENTQNHVEKPVCIFISVGGQDILDPAMLVLRVYKDLNLTDKLDRRERYAKVSTGYTIIIVSSSKLFYINSVNGEGLCRPLLSCYLFCLGYKVTGWVMLRSKLVAFCCYK